MNELKEIISIYNFEIILGLGASVILLLILSIISQIRISKMRKKYKKVTRGVDGLNLEQLVMAAGKEIDQLFIENTNIREKLDLIEKRQGKSLQKVGFIRYNAFGEMGRELSYSIALMDNYDNGFVITGIYGRDYSASYAKPLIKGESRIELSVEEMQAIDRALDSAV